MKVFIERTGAEIDSSAQTAAQLLRELSINAEEVLISQNGKLVGLDQELSEHDQIKIFSVISGG